MINDLIVKQDSFLVSGDRVFFTVQGEGNTIGIPAVFLRLHMCNLRCVWCDTPYAVFPDREDYKKEFQRWDFAKTLAEISKFNCKRLVITGGEPMLHFKAIEEFIKLIPDWKIEIETNGTIPPTVGLSERIQFNVSPKISNSGNSLSVRYRPVVLKALNMIPSTRFKFVVINNKDLEEIQAIINECKLDKDKIILMPEGVTIEANAKHMQDVAQLCKESGWRLLPRLQIFIWGLQRRT